MTGESLPAPTGAVDFPMRETWQLPPLEPRELRAARVYGRTAIPATGKSAQLMWTNLNLASRVVRERIWRRSPQGDTYATIAETEEFDEDSFRNAACS
jgi:hypothetical protein